MLITLRLPRGTIGPNGLMTHADKRRMQNASVGCFVVTGIHSVSMDPEDRGSRASEETSLGCCATKPWSRVVSGFRQSAGVFHDAVR